MIYSNKGDSYSDIGDITCHNKKGKIESFFKIGDTTYGKNNLTSYKIGETTYISRSSKQASFYKFGSTWYVSDGTRYDLLGEILRSSKGKYWYNVKTDKDVEKIIIAEF